MADTQVETPIQDLALVIGQGQQSEFARVISLYGRSIRESGALTLNQLIDHTLDLESRYGEKLTDEEFAVLTSLSLLLGASQRVITAEAPPQTDRSQKEKAYLESISAQQEVTQIILSNLDAQGKPKPEISRYYRIVSIVFEEYFNPENPKLEDAGLEKEAYFYQGVLGMVTTALLFRNAGYEIRFPPPIYDLKHDVDLIVRDESGNTYAVDITARLPENLGGESFDPLTLETKPVYPGHLRENLQISSFIKINVPPLWTHESNTFYEDRPTGYPSESAKNMFNQKLGKILQ